MCKIYCGDLLKTDDEQEEEQQRKRTKIKPLQKVRKRKTLGNDRKKTN